MTRIEGSTSADESAPGASRRVATIDIGTNTIRLLVAEAHPDGTYRLLDDERVVGRLGRDAAADHTLDEAAMRHATEAIGHMKKIADGYRVEVLRAVATCAVREAPNRKAFLRMVREEIGIDIEVISGEEEARLGWQSVKSAFDLRQRDVAMVDIGGGSTEVVAATGGVIETLASFSIGAVRLTEAVPENGTSAPKRLSRMRQRVRRQLREHVRRPAARPRTVIGIGGTFTTLAAMDRLRKTGSDGSAPAGSLRGYELTRAEVSRWVEHLAVMTRTERLAVPGLAEDRAGIIVAGLCIAEVVMRRLGASRLQVHDRGIRDGLLITITRSLFPRADEPQPLDRLGEVRRFARACRYERVHSEHVTGLTLRIFDQLQEAGLVPPDDPRDVLEAAAVLHDIGYYINYAKHHRHSHHLIVHANLRGFSHLEQEMAALIARYHRRAQPKQKHPEFAALEAPDREIVRRLSAILRIGDGLDRAHASNVEDVVVRAEGPVVHFEVVAEKAPEVDIWGAERKCRLFERVFERETRFEWQTPSDEQDAAPA